MYQMLANIKKIMARLAIHQTNPISTSSSQAVILFFCLARHPLQPPGPQHPIVLSPISTLTLDSPLSSQPLDLRRGPGPPSPPSTGSPPPTDRRNKSLITTLFTSRLLHSREKESVPQDLSRNHHGLAGSQLRQWHTVMGFPPCNFTWWWFISS